MATGEQAKGKTKRRQWSEPPLAAWYEPPLVAWGYAQKAGEEYNKVFVWVKNSLLDLQKQLLISLILEYYKLTLKTEFLNKNLEIET